MQRLHLSICSLVLLLTPLAHANLTVDRMFSDHMVLQRDMAVPVWGTADPGAEVMVQIGEHTQSTTAAPGGKWMVKVGPLSVGDPQTLKVSGGGREVAFSDVLIGEVWLGSGQSNMAGKAGSYAKNDPVLAENLQSGPYPGLRLYSPKGWAIADESSGKAFSAILYSFGLKLQQELDVPVGLMMGAVGGTPSVRWMTGDMMEANASLMAAMKEATGYTSVDDLRAAHDEALAKWKKVADALKAEGKEVPKFTGPTNPGDLYSRYIAPLAPYGIRGVLLGSG